MLAKKIAAGACVLVSVMAALNAKEPVVMKVGDREVPLSEFQYLYSKNNTQQQSQQDIDEYVNMFVDYKLKVADALAEKLDTLPSYKQELNSHCMELAAPYLTDSAVVDSLVRLVYGRMQVNRDIDHLMLPLADATHTPDQQKVRLDSMRTVIAEGKADFYELAKQYSIDPSVKTNSGHVGFIGANMFPYIFEDEVYSTSVGDMSPVFRTRYGYHLVRVKGERRNPGEVRARHILKLTRNKSAEEQQHAKAQIDSLYKVVTTPGADFAEVAKRESEDPGSARMGGDLSWFGPGRMVPEFEQAAFALAPGEISKPVATAYGYHIIKTEERRGMAPLDSVKRQLEETIMRGDRSELIQDLSLAPYAVKYPAAINSAARDSVKAIAERKGYLDPKDVNVLSAYEIPAVTVDGKSVMLKELIAPMNRGRIPNVSAVMELYDMLVDNQVRNLTSDAAAAHLEENEPAYRNLVNEYRDGMLLYEISNRKVWDKANKDADGQQGYFLKHRDKYKWNSPRYKGYVLSSVNDSIADAAIKYLSENSIERDSLTRKLRMHFGNDVKLEKALAAKGENNVIDYVGFGGKKPAPVGRWIAFRPYAGRIVPQPEEASDVRGAVSVDYQKQLEDEWLKELRAKYPVKINKKVLKKVK